jgi:hypothetical protein
VGRPVMAGNRPTRLNRSRAVPGCYLAALFRPFPVRPRALPPVATDAARPGPPPAQKSLAFRPQSQNRCGARIRSPLDGPWRRSVPGFFPGTGNLRLTQTAHPFIHRLAADDGAPRTLGSKELAAGC